MSVVPLGQLLPALTGLNPRGDVAPPRGMVVTGVEYDSRRCGPGSIFVCLAGRDHDGHRFATAAARAGASLVVGEEPGLEASLRPVPYLRVEDTRRALALLSCAFRQHPSRALTLTGVTGTNGKTSVAWMLHAIHLEAGWPSAVLGTLGSGTPGRGVEIDPEESAAEREPGLSAEPRADPYAGRVETPAPPFAGVPVRRGAHTTPEAPEFQREFARWRDHGLRAGVCEVSSHGLALRRSYGTRFACVVFTNLTEDHLDFHGTMDAYLEAKGRLFRREERGPEEPPARAVVNADDPRTSRLLDRSEDLVFRFGRKAGADVRLLEAVSRPDGIRLRVAHEGGEIDLSSPLLGSFQADNLLAAFTAARALGIEAETAARGLARLRAVPGRMESIERGQPFHVIVDYAHTPDALRRAAAALRPWTAGRLILVFGCGGDRDSAKRPLMGEEAARAADRIIITDDNPRSEDPGAIRAEIRVGVVRARGEADEVEDREEAIRRAFAEARAGDTVLIAGKGHETGQIRGDRTIPFDDREVAARWLEALGSGRMAAPDGGGRS